MILNKNTMYIYYEVINQLEPECVIDIGLFYKSIGGVSRLILNEEVSKKCYLLGVCTDSIEGLDIYNNIYNKIVAENKFYALCQSSSKRYKLAIMLSDSIPQDKKCEFIKITSQISSYILALYTDKELFDDNLDMVELSVDEDKYILVNLH